MLRIVVPAFLAVSASLTHAQAIHVRGRISDPGGSPVGKAVAELIRAGVKDTTGADGLYSLARNGSALRGQSRSPAAPIPWVAFDALGRDIPGGDPRPAAGFTSARAPLAKASAAVDTLLITAAGHAPKRIPIGTLDTLADVVLTPAGADRSAGCGKTPSLKSGNGQSFTPPGGGSARTFNLRIPADYDNARAYRLIVGLHWLNGTANNVSEGNSGATVKPYYGLWELANPAGSASTTLFVAPQGIGNGWGNSGGQDVRFITALVEKLAGEFCIDRSRIFAEGFSMGGSMSYALACGAPDLFRGVAAHSGGPMSGCDKSNRKPVAYFMTHGTRDGVCTYPGFGVPQVNDFAQLNGCRSMDIPATLKPTDNSGMNPTCADYQGCGAGHPARACIFVGDHTPTPGGAGSWVPGETWKFISGL